MIALRGDAEALRALSFNPGDILCFVSMIFWSGYTICLRLQRTPLEPIQLLFMVCALGLVTLAALARLGPGVRPARALQPERHRCACSTRRSPR